MTPLEKDIVDVILRYAKARGLKIPDGGLDLDKKMSDYGLESLDEVAIVGDIEDDLDLQIDDDKIADVSTLREFIEVVRAMNPPRPV